MEAEQQPKQDKPTKDPKQKGQKKGEPREKRPRPQRKNEYEYNAEIIDINTEIPPLPKKTEILPKPDIKVFKEKEKKNSQLIEDIINKKKQIRAEKFKFNRKAQQGDDKHSSLQSQFSQVQQLRDKLAELKVERNKLGDDLHNAITKAKANNDKLKQYRQALKGSKQNHEDRLRQLEHIQMTKELNKNQEKQIIAEINILKRKIKEADSSGNLEMKLEQAEDLKEQLDDQIAKIKKEKDPIDKQYDNLKAELDKKNEQITGLKTVLTAEKNEKTEEKERHDKEYQNWKEGKKQRLDKEEAKIQKIKQENEKIWEDFHKKQDDYWKQKQYIDFIEWQNKVKNRKIAEIEREKRRAEYEARDKEREREEQMKKYLGEIESINFLINYLNGFKDNERAQEAEGKKEVKVDQAEIAAKLNEGQWKKQKVEILQPKKSKEQQQPEKKHNKKNKKKQQQPKKEEKFQIPFNVETMFEKLGVLAPSSPEQIDKKIQELREREKLFERVAKEEATEEQKAIADKLKQKSTTQPKKEAKKQENKPIEDFPSI